MGSRLSIPFLSVVAATGLAVVLFIGYALGQGDGRKRPIAAQLQPSHNVVYLASQQSAGDLTPQRLATDLGAQIVTTWQDVLTAHANAEIDALIIDPGSISLVDWDWVKPKYRVGLMVVGINVHLETLGEALDEAEFAASSPGQWNGEFYSFAHASRNGTPASLTAIAQDPNHQPTGSDWVNEYLNGNESSTGPSPSANIEPGTTKYFFLDITTELDEQDDLDSLQQP